jgi:O-methyltransferase domain
MWNAAQHLDQATKTGRPNPDEFWSYLAENPYASQIFNDAMAAKAHAQVTAVVAAYDFSECGLVGDIGGGQGHLVQANLEVSPDSRGVLFDLPHVIEQASGMASDRLSLRAAALILETTSPSVFCGRTIEFQLHRNQRQYQ